MAKRKKTARKKKSKTSKKLPGQVPPKKKSPKKTAAAPTWTKREKRFFPRLPICARVSWQDALDRERYFFTRDLSRSGIFLLTDHPPALDEILTIELAIQYLKDPVTIQGRVVRHEAQEGMAVGCGVEFLEQDDYFNQIVQWIDQSLKNPPF